MKKILTVIVMICVFLLQVWRGSGPNAETYVVIFSGVMAAFLAWAILQLAFVLYVKFKK